MWERGGVGTERQRKKEDRYLHIVTSYTEGNSDASLSLMIVPIVTGYGGRFSSIPQGHRLPIVTSCTKADSHATLGHIKDSLSWYWPSLLCPHLHIESLTWLVWFQMLRIRTCTTPLTCTPTIIGSALMSKKAMEPFSVVLHILKRPLHLKWWFCLKKYNIIIKGWLLMLLLHLLYLNYRLVNCLMVAPKIA